MIQYGVITITMSSGVVPYAISDSAIIEMFSAMTTDPIPNKTVGGQYLLGGSLAIQPNANVLHSAEVDINPPDGTGG